MRVSKRDGRLLALMQFHADSSVSQRAEESGFKQHIIHYVLKRYSDSGAIRRGVLLDLGRLGMRQFTILFSLSRDGIKQRSKILTYFKSNSQVVWFGVLGGSYQYSVTILVKELDEVHLFLSKLAAKFGDILSKKAISALLSFSVFEKNYLFTTDRAASRELRSTQTQLGNVELEKLDWALLRALLKEDFVSIQETARQLGVQRSTIDYRLRKLKQEKVLVSSLFYISAARLGFHTYKLYLSARGSPPRLHNNLTRFAYEEPHIVNFSHCLGLWDYALTVEVFEPEQAIKIMEDIQQCFEREIDEIQLLPLFKQDTSSGFLKDRVK